MNFRNFFIRVASLAMLSGVCLISYGQESEAEKGESVYIAGVSPFILDHGEVETALTNSLTSYWNIFSAYNVDGEFFSNIYRLSIADHVFNIAYGFSKTGMWDLGAEFRYTFRRLDDVARNSPFMVYNGDPNSFSGLAYIGLRARAVPFGTLPNLTVQASVLFPNADKSVRYNLGADRVQLNMFATYYETIDFKLGYFLQGGWGFHLPGSASRGLVNAANVAAYLSYNAYTNRIFVIPGLAYSGTFQSDMSQLAQGVFGILVLQFQPNTRASINLQHGLPLLFESHQPQVAFERSSFSSTSLGIRLLF